MNICVIGLGFVGLSMAVVFASKGFRVFGVENDKEKASQISQGKIPFFEPKVKEFFLSTLGKNFEITTTFSEAASKSDIIFICVGTPSNSDGSSDLTFIKKVSHEIGEILKNSNSFKIIVVKSTVPPNTTNNLVKTTIEKVSTKKSGIDFGLCMNPEFLKEGTAVDDMLSPHLVVIGTEDEQTRKTMHDFL